MDRGDKLLQVKWQKVQYVGHIRDSYHEVEQSRVHGKIITWVRLIYT